MGHHLTTAMPSNYCYVSRCDNLQTKTRCALISSDGCHGSGVSAHVHNKAFMKCIHETLPYNLFAVPLLLLQLLLAMETLDW